MLIGKAGLGTQFRKTIKHVLKAYCPFGSPLLLLATRGIPVLKCSRLFVESHIWSPADGMLGRGRVQAKFKATAE